MVTFTKSYTLDKPLKHNIMKRILLAVLCSVVSVFGLSAQVVQTTGPLTISLESTRIIGDRMVVSGKMTVDREVRLRLMTANAITTEGDSHSPANMMFGGKEVSISTFDQIFQAGIPYSFDIYFETQNMNMDPVAALMIDIRDHGAGVGLKFSFPNVRVPMVPDQNLVPGTMEIGKDIYLRWTKFEESAAGLKIDFLVMNKSNKDQQMYFLSYNNAKIIDKDGNIHEGALTLSDWVTFPTGTPVAGSISIKEPVKMGDVVMVQFQTRNFKYSVKELVFR